MRWVRPFLLSVGIFLLLFGVITVSFPYDMARTIGVVATTPDAVIELRSGMGVYIGMGLMITHLGAIGRHLQLGLLIVAFMTFGLLIGRVIGLLFDGGQNPVSNYSLVFEACVFALALAFAYRGRGSFENTRSE